MLSGTPPPTHDGFNWWEPVDKENKVFKNIQIRNNPSQGIESIACHLITRTAPPFGDSRLFVLQQVERNVYRLILVACVRKQKKQRVLCRNWHHAILGGK